jgi:hypothetical protein
MDDTEKNYEQQIINADVQMSNVFTVKEKTVIINNNGNT